jgi:hypothetical protein
MAFRRPTNNVVTNLHDREILRVKILYLVDVGSDTRERVGISLRDEEIAVVVCHY